MDIWTLQQHPFVQTLRPSQAQRLLSCARVADFHENAFIFREGQEADALYLLEAGCVALEQHIPGQGVVTLESLCAGDILGLSWLFPPARWMHDARCVDAVRAIALRADCVRERMQEDPALALALLTHMLQALYNRLVRVRLQRLDVYKAGDVR